MTATTLRNAMSGLLVLVGCMVAPRAWAREASRAAEIVGTNSRQRPSAAVISVRS